MPDKAVNKVIYGNNVLIDITDTTAQASDVVQGKDFYGADGIKTSGTAVVPSKTSDLINDSGFITTETDPTVPAWAKASTKPSYTAAEVGALPDTTTIPSKTSDLTNDSGFITTETDPTVPAWAKASTKPSYTASEVGALPDDTDIPSQISDLTNDMVCDLGTPAFNDDGSFSLTQEQHTAIMQMWNNGLCAVTMTVDDTTYWAIKEGVFTLNDMTFNIFVGTWATVAIIPLVGPYPTSGTVAVGIMPNMPLGVFFKVKDLDGVEVDDMISYGVQRYESVHSVNNQTGQVVLTASDVGAVSTNTVGAASGVAPLNASSKIDETYLPSYVDDVIEGYFYNGSFYKESSHTTVITGESGKIYVDLTTDKTYRYSGSTFVEISSGTTVSVSRDLTTGTKVATITVNGTGSDIYAPTPPTKVSDLTNDSGFITGISSSDVTTALGYTPYNSTNPNSYVDASGAASAAPVQSVNGQIGTVVLDAEDVGALPDDTVIPSKTSDLTNDSGFITGMTILSYGSSTWQDFLDAYNANKVVYCRASSNSNPASGSQTRLAFMAYVSNATNPTNVEFQYYRSMSSHSETQQGDEVYVYKLANNGTWTVTVRKTSPNIVAGTGLSRSYNNDTVTLSFDGTIPTKTSDLTNDSGFITTETDPTVPSWAKASTKPSYTASEVGALSDDTDIPSKISDLTNDQVYDLGTRTLTTGGQISLTSEEQSDILAMWNRGACAIRVTISDQTYMLLKEQDITYFEIPLHVFSGAWVGLDANGKAISKKIALAVSTLVNYPIATYAEVNDVVSVNGHTGTVSLDAFDVGALSSDTDIFKVKQSVLSDDEDDYHTLLMGEYERLERNTFNPITTNAWAYVHKYFSCQPSTGTIRANIFKGELNGTISSDTTAVTQTASDNSTKVATTAFVKSQGYLTLSDLPVWDGSVT